MLYQQIKGLGLDITPIHRIARLVDRYDSETLNLLFTANEIDHCQSANNYHQYYAICFATKEAVGKALSTGLVGIDWNEIEAEITLDNLIIHLYGKASHQAKKLKIQKWVANWCNWDQHVLVQVLAF
ncbi:holo-ACP synthase [Nostoc sp. LEGE 12450]|uniref:holo-ACP synthase n=1 Tax=Nostoc sp. LEGE 12450 TaxID=1828643 RepID=UPI0018816AF5|nr:4'-phosphopantetheinyl transferase superfamily protein [Nostoc sp. LEGE 12450]MBE8987825.1 4'-phosphopantetheinyl transferase superfamily protein [Nostoc sp. LEGE 12450]